MEKDYSHIFNTKHFETDLKKQSLKSGAVTLTSQGLMFLIQFGSTMILARILVPEDYGIMTMVVSVTGLAGIFSSLGLSTATVQRAEINHIQVSTLFWINVGVSALIMLIVAALSPAVAWFYKKPELVWVMLALSGNFLISGLGIQHHALLTRQMRFYSIAKIQILSNLMGLAVAIVSAKHGLGYWSLVLNSIITAAFNSLGIWISLKWIPGLPRRDNDVLSMLRFGSDLVGFNIINYFSRNLDNILIGRSWGGAALGQYSKAYQLLMMPITNLRDPLTRVAMSSLSRLQNDPEQYRNYYIKLLSILAFLSMPLVVFMFVCSDSIILLVLGPQWMEASVLFKILAIAALFQTIASTRGMVLLSTGNSRKYLIWGGINAFFTSLAFFIGLPWGAKGVATAYAIVNYLLLYPSLIYVYKGTPVNINDFFAACYKPSFASLAMGSACFFVLKSISSLSEFVALVICFFSSVVVYLIGFVIISGGFKDLQEYYSYVRLLVARKKT